MPNSPDDKKWTLPLQSDAITHELVEAIGAVAVCLTNTDAQLVELFQHVADLETDTAHAITKDLRPIQIQKMIVDIMRAKDMPGREIIETRLSTLSDLRQKRNEFLHWAWYKSEESLRIKKIGLTDDAAQKDVTLQDIRKTAKELAFIYASLLLFTLPPEERERIHRELLAAATTARTHHSSEDIDD